MMSSLQIALNERKVELKVIITLPHMINTAIIRLHGMQIICKCFVFIQQIGIQIIYRRFWFLDTYLSNQRLIVVL